MAIINIQNIVTGMVLAEDAIHNSGRVLLKAGTKLNDKHIKIFKTWGLSSLNIISDENEGSNSKKKHTAEKIKQVIAEQKQAFRYCDLNDPFINKLFRASVNIKLK